MKTEIKATATVAEMSALQWDYLQDVLLTSYPFTEGDIRLCATFSHRELERHAEMPVTEFIALVDKLEAIQLRGTVSALLTPDELAPYLQGVRNDADPAREPGSTGPSYGAGHGEGR